MNIIYSYNSGLMILYSKYKIYYQPLNPPNYPLKFRIQLIPNYVFKIVLGNINYKINHGILTRNEEMEEKWVHTFHHSKQSTLITMEKTAKRIIRYDIR